MLDHLVVSPSKAWAISQDTLEHRPSHSQFTLDAEVRGDSGAGCRRRPVQTNGSTGAGIVVPFRRPGGIDAGQLTDETSATSRSCLGAAMLRGATLFTGADAAFLDPSNAEDVFSYWN